MGALHVVLTAVLCCGGTPGRLTLALHTAGAQNSSYYATGGSGFMLMSNYTTDAISVATAGAMCYNGAPGYPVVEATISSIHQVSHPTALAAHRCCHGLQHDTSHCCGRTIQHVLQSGVRKPHRVLPRPLLQSHVCAVTPTPSLHQCLDSSTGLPVMMCWSLGSPLHALELDTLPHAANRTVPILHGIAFGHINAGMSETRIS